MTICDIAQPVLEVSEKERRGAMQEPAGRATWSLTVLSPAFVTTSSMRAWAWPDKMSQEILGEVETF